MQRKKITPNKERSERTTQSLRRAARTLFVEKGFANTSTSDVVTLAGLTRGALYHHYEDKKDLFEDIIEEELATVTAEIERRGSEAKDPVGELKGGSVGFITAMTRPGRARLMLIEAPAVLGHERLTELEDRHTRGSLREGLQAAIASGDMPCVDLESLVDLLSAAFDRASLRIETGADRAEVEPAMMALIDGLVALARSQSNTGNRRGGPTA